MGLKDLEGGNYVPTGSLIFGFILQNLKVSQRDYYIFEEIKKKFNTTSEKLQHTHKSTMNFVRIGSYNNVHCKYL